uniref:Uncharacterized protein n=1 Tax=Plectus sambesii TaxID=2011161 RepID=A0A914X431_9BILA
MASAKTGVHVLTLKKPEVQEYLCKGERFYKFDEAHAHWGQIARNKTEQSVACCCCFGAAMKRSCARSGIRVTIDFAGPDERPPTTGRRPLWAVRKFDLTPPSSSARLALDDGRAAPFLYSPPSTGGARAPTPGTLFGAT